MNYIVTGKDFISPLLLQLKSEKNIKIIQEEDIEKAAFSFFDKDKLYIPSESSLWIVQERIKSPERKRLIENLKDKLKCRELLKNIFPDFYFKPIKLEKLEKEVIPKGKLIIKPTRGFFGVGAKVITSNTDFKNLTKEIKNELKKNTGFFSKEVLSRKDLIIEEYVGGEEFAVDMFYSEKGEPVIINIYHHPLPINLAYPNILYYSNYQIFQNLYDIIRKFFTRFNKIFKARSFPIHAEFKLQDGKIVPIEFNPARFGGFGLADLTFYSYGFNPFLTFFNDLKPDWKEIWASRKGKNFAFVLGYNGVKINTKNYQPDHEKFKNMFDKINNYYKLDYQKNPAFAIIYVEEKDKEKLFSVLGADFNDFFRKICH